MPWYRLRMNKRTDNPQKKNPNAVALGRLGGKKGGVARAKALTPERRKEISQKAIASRWERDGGDINVLAHRIGEAATKGK